MQILYHVPFDPFCRKVRAFLREIGLNFELNTLDMIEKPKDFIHINPSEEVPVLELGDYNTRLCGHDVICETIGEMMQSETLLGDMSDMAIRAEVRRLTRWFDISFYNEVTCHLFHEKIIKPYSGEGSANPRALQAGFINLRRHFAYMKWLLQKQNWLACDNFSLADIAAAAQISVIDYTGDVAWSKYPEIKQWYVLVKSRPSFQPFWQEYISGRVPPQWYKELDF